MYRSLNLVFLFLFLFQSCLNVNRKDQHNLKLIDEVQEVIAGRDSTSGLIALRDKELPPAINPNSVGSDTFTAFNRKFITVLAEYPNPVYNRFAIIDSDYNILLLDKSLNGYLNENLMTIGQIHLVRVGENFLSKGVLGLKRLSLYSVTENGEAGLIFRTFTELKEPGATYRQDILQIDPGKIETRIYSTGNGNSQLKPGIKIYYYDPKTGIYTNETNPFDLFVLSEVSNYNSQSYKPEITSRSSSLRQLGINPPETTTEHRVGRFSMPLSDEWNEVKYVKFSSFLKKTVSGTKFINNHYGAEISVIQIPGNDSAESYIKYPLENISSGNYRVRFSEKISGDKYYYQFFEYSCGSEKFLLILQTLKTTYDLYKSDYQNLINSFSMEC